MHSIEKEPILTISQLTSLIKNNLEGAYKFVRIRGEISNLKTPLSGHSYFSLKDQSSQIRGVLFKQQKRFVELGLHNGQEVVCFGRITVYEPRGEYQLVVDTVELYGIGSLQIQFDQLKEKLIGMGYFAREFKKTLSPYPQKIVVISSPTGAAIHDFLKIVSNRSSSVHIQIIPVNVQGKGAAVEIAGAIATANSIEDIDIIVLCRGGGSLEDLWAFNETPVAEAIHRSTIPIVTGIGHEIDFTIADFCADIRCSSPTAAAEEIIPDNHTLVNHLRSLEMSLSDRIKKKINLMDQELRHSINMLGDMKNVFKNAEFHLQLSKSYFFGAINKNIAMRDSRFYTGLRRLQAQDPTARLELLEKHSQMLKRQLQYHMQHILENKQASLAEQAGLLNGMSPLATLGRGYSIVRKFDKEKGSYFLISDSNHVKPGEKLNILLHKGQLDCTVSDKK